MLARFREFGKLKGLVFGAAGEVNKDVDKLIGRGDVRFGGRRHDDACSGGRAGLAAQAEAGASGAQAASQVAVGQAPGHRTRRTTCGERAHECTARGKAQAIQQT